MSVAELRQEDIAFQANLYESSNPTRRWLHNARREWITHALYQVARDKAAYLEIGIGCGIYTQLMAKRGPVTAVDINSAFVSAANQLHNVSARIADITTPKSAYLIVIPIYLFLFFFAVKGHKIKPKQK